MYTENLNANAIKPRTRLWFRAYTQATQPSTHPIVHACVFVGTHNLSCWPASCHMDQRGWARGFVTRRAFSRHKKTHRATLTHDEEYCTAVLWSPCAFWGPGKTQWGLCMGFEGLEKFSGALDCGDLCTSCGVDERSGGFMHCGDLCAFWVPGRMHWGL